MADLQTIGRALQGLSAGIGGQLPAFNEGLRRQEQQQQKQAQRLSLERQQALAQDWIAARGALSRGDVGGAQGILQNRVDVLGQTGGDPSESLAALNAISSAQSPEDLQNVIGQFDDDLRSLAAIGVIEGSGLGFGGATSGEKTRTALLRDLKSDDPSIARSAEIALGLSPRAVGSAVTTLAGQAPEAVQAVAAVEETISAGREAGRQRAQLTFKPQITKAVKLAEKDATARGEALTDLNRLEAGLPGLQDAVGQLRDLAGIATSTIGGRAFDFAVKESGFGSTKGSDARAKWIAIIDNQMLPLLKQTFGAAFTAQEGANLKATMGDPDASPTQKMDTLDAFMDGKIREIQTKQREVGAVPAGGQAAPQRFVFDPATGQLVPK